jgi:ABC-2 type transport system ATP-binding protein
MGRRVVLELISELRGKTTVFFSTHLLPDVERVCDSAAIIDAGRVVTSGPLEQIRAKNSATRARLLVEVDVPVKLQQALAEQPWVLSVTEAEAPGALVVAVTDLDEAAVRLPAQIADLGLRLRRLEPQESSLEDVFVGIVGARS